MEIIAHRGASHDAPENTLAAINLAWEQGADAVEVDVQLSSDGRLVVIHDETTTKTAGIEGNVCDRSFNDLCKLDVGRWKHARWKGERIPGVDAVLAAIPLGKRLFIEIKCGGGGLDDLKRAIRSSTCKPDQLVIIGFCKETMRKVKALLPELETSWVVKCNRRWGRWRPTTTELIDEAKGVGLDGLDMGANRPLSAAIVRQIHEAGLKVYVWTVDSPIKARALAEAGIDGVTTNRPGWLRKRLS